MVRRVSIQGGEHVHPSDDTSTIEVTDEVVAMEPGASGVIGDREKRRGPLHADNRSDAKLEA